MMRIAEPIVRIHSSPAGVRRELDLGVVRTVVRFLKQVRGDGFAGVVREERDRTQRDLRSRCCYRAHV
jgi:hypothetical protein